MSKSRKANLMVLVALSIFSVSAHAQLLHNYGFDAAAVPLADSTGGAPLLNAWTVTFGDEDALSFATFDGNGDYLVVDETSEPFSLGGYTLSFWFRLDTLSQVNWSALFSSASDGSGSGYQVDFHSGVLRFITGISGQTVDIALIDDLGAGEWHLLTLTPDAIWINGVSVDYANGYNLPSLMDFAIGANRARSKSFQGDIADVRIYGAGTNWNAVMQDNAYIAGPYGLFQPARGTVIMISSIVERFLPGIGALGVE